MGTQKNGAAAALPSTPASQPGAFPYLLEHGSEWPLLLPPQVGAIPANALDDGQWSQGLISAVSVQHPLGPSELERLERAGEGMNPGQRHILI